MQNWKLRGSTLNSKGAKSAVFTVSTPVLTPRVIRVQGKQRDQPLTRDKSPALLTHRQVIANHRKKNAVKPCVDWFHGIMTFSKFSSTCPIATI